MRAKFALAGVAAAALSGGLAMTATGEAGQTSREYVVLYQHGTSVAAGQKAVEAAGGTVVAVNKAIGLATVRSTSSSFRQDAAAAKAVEGVATDRAIGRAPAERQKDRDVERGLGAAADELGTRQAGGSAEEGGDPLSGQQWDMKMIGATPSGSYATQRGSHQVRVGIIDTGVDGSHPDIRDNFDFALSRNFTTDIPSIDGPCASDPDGSCSDPADVDEDGHGTHVASTIGSPLNGVGMAGVAPGVDLVNIRAGQDSGYFFLTPTVNALTYAGDNGIDVVNMSFYIDPWLFNCASNPADSPAQQLEQRTIIEATQRALDYARNHNVTLVSALGNEHTDLGDPGVDDTSPDFSPDGSVDPYERTIDNATCLSMPTEGNGVIGVSSVGPTGRKAFYSNYGEEQTDVAAPGGDSREFFGSAGYNAPENRILAALPNSVARTETFNDDGDPSTPEIPRVNARGVPNDPTVVRSCSGSICAYYQWIQGTSMASPHAAGVAALIVAARGTPDPVHGGLTLAPSEVERVLYETATDKPCPDQEPFVYPFSATYTATCTGTAAKNGFFGEGIVNAAAAGAAPTPGAPAQTPAPSLVAGTPAPAAAPAPAVTSAPVRASAESSARAAAKPVVSVRFTVSKTGTRVTRLAVRGARGATVTVTAGKLARRLRVSATGTRNLLKGAVRLKPGATLKVRVAMPGQKARTFAWTARAGRAPKAA